MKTQRAHRRGGLAALAAVLSAACLSLPASADELPPPRPLLGQGAYPAGPFVPLDTGLRVDALYLLVLGLVQPVRVDVE